MIVTPQPTGKEMPQETAESGGFFQPPAGPPPGSSGPSNSPAPGPSAHDPPPSYDAAPATHFTPSSAHSSFAPPIPNPSQQNPSIPPQQPLPHQPTGFAGGALDVQTLQHYGRRRRERMHDFHENMHHPTKHVDYAVSWNRPPSTGLPNLSFEPTFLTPQVRNSLSKGFPASPPPTDLRPHPFTTNDVTELDWRNFVDHIAEGAKLTKKEREIARRNIPILNIVPIVGQVLQYGTEAYLRSKKPAAAAHVVDTWNHHFFHPRKLEVALYKGPECISRAHVLGGSAPLPSDSHVAPPSSSASSPSPRPEKSQFGDFRSSGTSSGSGKGSSIMRMTSSSSASGKGKEKDEQFKLYLSPFNAVTTPQ